MKRKLIGKILFTGIAFFLALGMIFSRAIWKTNAKEYFEGISFLTAETNASYLDNCTKVEKKYIAKVTASSTDLMTLPCTNTQNTSSKKTMSLSKGAKIDVICLWINPKSDYWAEVSYDSGSSCVHGYVSFLDITSRYLDECTSYTSAATLTVTADSTYLKELPCSVSTDGASTDVVKLSKNAKLTATALYKNTAGNYWYKANYTSGSTTKTGFIYSTNVSTSLNGMAASDFSVSSVTAPTGTRTVGESLTLKGKVTSSVLPLVKVGAFVYSGTATSGTAETGGWATASGKSFSIQGTDADSKCKIGSLGEGSHTYTIKVNVKNNYCTDGKTMQTSTKDIVIYKSSFTEVIKYTISYNANGGTGAPASQTKTKNVTLTLSSTKPTRSNASAGSYTVTFDANGGSCSTSSLSAARTTSYSFKNWNTKADGSGTSYASGGSYTANAAATLYAQWNSSTSTAAISLPTPSRSNYNFLGWALNSSGTGTLYTGSYVPSGSVTIYAAWQKETENIVITTQPANKNIKAGNTAVFTVAASGTNLSYQWQWKTSNATSWTNSSSATTGYNTPSLHVAGTPARDGYLYRCRITNAEGTTVYSNAVTLRVLGIKTQPASVTAGVDTSATFKVVATGSSLSYQWQWSGDGGTTWMNSSSSTTGYNTAALTVKAAASRNGYKYRCVVSNSAGTVTSNAATLRVGELPVISKNPVSVSAKVNENVNFNVTASGSGLKYQWQWSSDAGKTWKNSSSATKGYNTATLTVTATAARNGYKYRCKVTNSTGTVTSGTATLTVVSKPAITTQPKNAMVAENGTATFKVAATGGSLSYQWQWSSDGGKTWKNSSSATKGYNTATLSVVGTTARNGYKYRCVVTNKAGTTTSDTATLYVE